VRRDACCLRRRRVGFDGGTGTGRVRVVHATLPRGQRSARLASASYRRRRRRRCARGVCRQRPHRPGRASCVLPYCASACTSASRFAAVAISDGLGDAQLQLTPAGKPRILLAATPSSAANTIEHQQLHYLWCDSSCTVQLGQWRSMNLSLPATYGQEGVDFALDGQNRPRMAVRVPVRWTNWPTCGAIRDA